MRSHTEVPGATGIYHDSEETLQMQNSVEIALGMTWKPTRKQWNRSPMYNELKNGRGGGELYDQLPNVCVLPHAAGYPVLLVMKFLDTVCGV